MANLRRAGNLPLLLLLTATTGVLGACTLLLSKEPLTCATNNDCAKYPGTTCDLQALECRAGGSGIDGPLVEAGGDAPSDGPIPFEGGDPCTNPNKPVVELKGDILANMTLKCDSDYVLIGVVTVVAPATLTIEPNTTIYGDTTVDPATSGLGTLLITAAAKIMAVGEQDKPIVFTSAKKLGGKYAGDGAVVEAGDWGGVYIMGEAPVNTPTQTSTKAAFKERGVFGGAKTSSNSGHLEYVRIEYGGSKLPNGDDGAVLDLAGVGDATVIDHVMTRFSLNDCIEILGGTAQIKHFLCQYPSDDGLAWDQGWTGKAQFIVVQGRPNINDSANGIQGRSGSAAGPFSEPKIYNATFIGQGKIPTETQPAGRTLQYGVRLEKYSRAHIFNSIFQAWSDSAIDLRGSTVAADVAAGGIEIKSCIAFNNLGDGLGVPGNNVAFIENTASGSEATDPASDDDNGFDELAWWRTAGFNNGEADPGIPKPLDPDAPGLSASAAINPTGAAQPPSDSFFNPDAKYVGAFGGSSDLWATGKWVRWSSQ